MSPLGESRQGQPTAEEVRAAEQASDTVFDGDDDRSTTAGATDGTSGGQGATPPAEPPHAVRKLHTRGIDRKRVRRTRWIWEGRFPAGYLTLIVGEEEVGKSILACHFVAQHSQGLLPGDYANGQNGNKILIVADEDSVDDIWTPRLIVAGAREDNIRYLADDAPGMNIYTHAADLKALIRDEEITMVYLDAVMDNLPPGCDSWRSDQVREAFRPLRGVLRDTGCAGVMSLHANKGRHTSFRDLMSGTHAFNALPRASFLVTKDPGDPERRMMVRGKGNLGKLPASIEYQIESQLKTINGEEHDVGAARKVMEGDRVHANDVLQQHSAASSSPIRNALQAELEGDTFKPGEHSLAAVCRELGRDPKDQTVRRALDASDAWIQEEAGKPWKRLAVL